jgi:hypothetical protein
VRIPAVPPHAAYLRWFRESRLVPVGHRFISEGNVGHGLILATAG